MYQANVSLYIMNRDKVLTKGETLSAQDLAVSQQLVRQYSEIISSRSLVLAVLKEVKDYNLTEETLLEMIFFDGKKDSSILTISVKWNDPAVAAIVANATAREFTSQIRKITNSDNVGILDEAVIPTIPVSSRMLKILLGILAGLIISLGFIYINDYFDTTVRSVEDIENGLGLRVIGIMPEYDIR